MIRAWTWLRRWWWAVLAGAVGLLAIVWRCRAVPAPVSVAGTLRRLHDARDREDLALIRIREERERALDAARREHARALDQIEEQRRRRIERLAAAEAERRRLIDDELREAGLDPGEHRR